MQKMEDRHTEERQTAFLRAVRVQLMRQSQIKIVGLAAVQNTQSIALPVGKEAHSRTDHYKLVHPSGFHIKARLEKMQRLETAGALMQPVQTFG